MQRKVQSYRRTYLLMQEYVKNCLYLIFDAALFYSRSKDFKDKVNEIVSSREVYELIEMIRRYKDKAGVSDILAFI